MIGTTGATFVHASTRWGSGYRHRYYINGKLTAERQWDLDLATMKAAFPDVQSVTQATDYGWRQVWSFHR